jgi:hypothetical protein
MKPNSFRLKSSLEARHTLYHSKYQQPVPKTGHPAIAMQLSMPTPVVHCLTIAPWETISWADRLRLARQQCATRNQLGIQAWLVRQVLTLAKFFSLQIRGWLRQAARWFALQAAQLHFQLAPMFVIEVVETASVTVKENHPVHAMSSSDSKTVRSNHNSKPEAA